MNSGMITVREAQTLIRKNCPRLWKVLLPITDALGYVVAEDVESNLALPLFDNSAMDGFVLKSRDTKFASRANPVFLKIKGIIKAGDEPRRVLQAGETYKIMTGAFIPQSGDTVLPKEEAFVQENRLIIRDPLSCGTHIRYQGEELRKGTRVLQKFTVINPGTVGFLASLGRSEIRVFRKPRVSVIATGNELTKPNQPLKAGKIYDSNSAMISSALKSLGIKPSLVRTVQDKPGILRKIIRKALRSSDIVILIGGISVGDYDCVKEVLRELRVRQILWKVNQKPGKPLYFGKRGKVLVFGLPGNPSSAFTCFYEYVYLAIRFMSGFPNPRLHEEKQRLSKTVKSDRKRLVFLKAKVSSSRNGKAAIPLPHQGSHMISSLREANCFILLPPNGGVVQKGESVVTHVLPYHGENIA